MKKMTGCRRTGYTLLSCLIFAAYILAGKKTIAQESAITGPMHYTVKSTRIKGRWVPPALQKRVDSIMTVGGLYDPPNLSIAQSCIADELTAPEESMLQYIKGATSVLYVSSRIKADTTKREVEIEFYPYYLRIDLVTVGNNVLPVPRSPMASFLTNVSPVIWATSPIVGVYFDKNYGQALFAQTQTDLLHISQRNPNASPYHLTLDLYGMKSVSNPFYTFRPGLVFSKVVANDKAPGWLVETNYNSTQAPLGDNSYDLSTFNINGAIQGNSPIRFFSKFIFNAGFTTSHNSYTEHTKQSFNETGFNLALTTDKRLGAGLGRIGIYFDDHFLKNSVYTSYQRLSSQLAYETVLGKGHTNFDLEVSVGGGLSWGERPSYSNFWAGNSSKNFLYEPLTSSLGSSLVTGPLVRSLGENEGGLYSSTGNSYGGTSYWNLNLALSIPIPSLSRPLIPDITIREKPTEPPERVTLRDALKGASNFAENAIIEDLVKSGFPDNDSTEAIAKAIINRDIRPTLNYLADRANIYSIKPVVLFDAARLYNKSTADAKTWFAAGIGLQLTVVVAKLQIGYMHTISPESDSKKGNLLLRFTLQNFY